MKDALGTRMKNFFESRTKTKLIRKCPVVQHFFIFFV